MFQGCELWVHYCIHNSMLCNCTTTHASSLFFQAKHIWICFGRAISLFPYFETNNPPKYYPPGTNEPIVIDSWSYIKHQCNPCFSLSIVRTYTNISPIHTELVEQNSSARLPINRTMIQTFKRRACATVLDRVKSDEQRKQYLYFTASEDRAKNFITYKGLRSVGVHGEPGSVDDAAIAEGMAAIRDTCRKYESENTYNEDETRLCYRVCCPCTYTWRQGRTAKRLGA